MNPFVPKIRPTNDFVLTNKNSLVENVVPLLSKQSRVQSTCIDVEIALLKKRNAEIEAESIIMKVNNAKLMIQNFEFNSPI